VLADWAHRDCRGGRLHSPVHVRARKWRSGPATTIYYLEFFPRAAAQNGARARAGHGAHAGRRRCRLRVGFRACRGRPRAIQRGLVTPDRTTLISSTHRSYAIGREKRDGAGRGRFGTADRSGAQPGEAPGAIRYGRDGPSAIRASSAPCLLGALCGSGVLPFRKQTFEDEIKKSGIAVKANLAAFDDACQRAQRGDSGFTGKRRT